jgi:hypothetical protein
MSNGSHWSIAGSPQFNFFCINFISVQIFSGSHMLTFPLPIHIQWEPSCLLVLTAFKSVRRDIEVKVLYVMSNLSGHGMNSGSSNGEFFSFKLMIIKIEITIKIKRQQIYQTRRRRNV